MDSTNFQMENKPFADISSNHEWDGMGTINETPRVGNYQPTQIKFPNCTFVIKHQTARTTAAETTKFVWKSHNSASKQGIVGICNVPKFIHNFWNKSFLGIGCCR